MEEKRLEVELVLPEILKEYFIGHKDGPITFHLPKLSEELLNGGVTFPIPIYPNKNDFPKHIFLKLKYIYDEKEEDK